MYISYDGLLLSVRLPSAFDLIIISPSHAHDYINVISELIGEIEDCRHAGNRGKFTTVDWYT